VRLKVGRWAGARSNVTQPPAFEAVLTITAEPARSGPDNFRSRAANFQANPRGERRGWGAPRIHLIMTREAWGYARVKHLDFDAVISHPRQQSRAATLIERPKTGGP